MSYFSFCFPTPYLSACHNSSSSSARRCTPPARSCCAARTAARKRRVRSTSLRAAARAGPVTLAMGRRKETPQDIFLVNHGKNMAKMGKMEGNHRKNWKNQRKPWEKGNMEETI